MRTLCVGLSILLAVSLLTACETTRHRARGEPAHTEVHEMGALARTRIDRMSDAQRARVCSQLEGRHAGLSQSQAGTGICRAMAMSFAESAVGTDDPDRLVEVCENEYAVCMADNGEQPLDCSSLRLESCASTLTEVLACVDAVETAMRDAFEPLAGLSCSRLANDDGIRRVSTAQQSVQTMPAACRPVLDACPGLFMR